jgi:hypothetical protein
MVGKNLQSIGNTLVAFFIGDPRVKDENNEECHAAKGG